MSNSSTCTDGPTCLAWGLVEVGGLKSRSLARPIAPSLLETDGFTPPGRCWSVVALYMALLVT